MYDAGLGGRSDAPAGASLGRRCGDLVFGHPLPLRAMGMPLTFGDEGPRLQPLADLAAIDALRVLSPDVLPEVLERCGFCAASCPTLFR